MPGDLNPSKSDVQRASDDDRALLAAIANADASALATLYDRHGGLLLAVCQRIVTDRMAAEEVLEDVFWEVWSRPQRYDPKRASPLVYLIMLCRSRSLDRLRSMGRGKRKPAAGSDGAPPATHAPREIAIANDGSAAGSPRIGHVEEDPLQESIAGEQRQDIRRAVEQLATDQRRAIELAFFGGLTHQQISETLDQPLGTVKTRIRQALVHLKVALNRLEMQ